MAVGEDDGGQLELIVQEVTIVEMCDRNFVLTPERQRTIQLCEVLAIIGKISAGILYTFGHFVLQELCTSQ